MEGSGLRCGEAVSGEGERSQVEASGLMWRGAIAGGRKRSQVEWSDRWWRGWAAKFHYFFSTLKRSAADSISGDGIFGRKNIF